jgi:hypothetical protein
LKTYHIFGILIATGTEDELARVDKLAAGTHHITAYGRKRGPKPRKRPIESYTDEERATIAMMEGSIMHGDPSTEPMSMTGISGRIGGQQAYITSVSGIGPKPWHGVRGEASA